MPYRIEYSPDARDHLRYLAAHQRARVLDTVEEQLIGQPMTVTRNRKPLRPNQLALWELRIGNLRVYYDVVEDPAPLVLVCAVGVKERNQVRVGGQVIQL